MKDGGGPDINLHNVMIKMNKWENVACDEEIAMLSTGIDTI